MTNQQIELANEMYASGITYEIIASYFGVNASTLRKYQKQYEQNNKILRATATG